MPKYQGVEVKVEPLPKDDPRRAGHPVDADLIIVKDVGGAPDKVIYKTDLDDEKHEKPVERSGDPSRGQAPSKVISSADHSKK